MRRQKGRDGIERGLRALDVRCEIDEIDVRVPLFLATIFEVVTSLSNSTVVNLPGARVIANVFVTPGLTAAAPVFVTTNLAGPAGTLSAIGRHPAATSSTFTTRISVLAGPEVDDFDEHALSVRPVTRENTTAAAPLVSPHLLPPTQVNLTRGVRPESTTESGRSQPR